MSMAQLLPQAKIAIVTTPQPAAQSVAARSAEMSAKVDVEVMGIIENMSGFTTPTGEKFSIFGEGGGQLLADELEVPLFGNVPLSEELREHADTGNPLSVDQPGSPAGEAIVSIARKIIASTPRELPMIQAIQTSAPEIKPKLGANARELPVL